MSVAEMAQSGQMRRPVPHAQASAGKAPRTARGQKTLDKILDAAIEEFGTNGFHDSSIVGITARAKVALGTFYTYFDSKEALFAELVRTMSDRVRTTVAPALTEGRDALDGERRALAAYLGFVERHRHIYRIIDEAEFVDPAGYAGHYRGTATRIAERLAAGIAAGDLRAAPRVDGVDPVEVQAWAIMGMNVFLGMRFGLLDHAPPDAVAAIANDLLAHGLHRRDGPDESS